MTPNTPEKKEVKKHSFPESALSRYQTAKELRELCNDDRQLAIDYLDLFRLKEELELFIWDITSLDQGQHIVYAIDDVCFLAFVEMDEGNRRSFAFPVSEESATPEQLEIRAAEYEARLHRLFFPVGGENRNLPPLLVLPSAMPGLLGFAQYLKKHGMKNKDNIDLHLNEITEQMPGELKRALDEVVKKILSSPPLSHLRQPHQIAKNASNYLKQHLHALYQYLWNTEQTREYIQIFKKLLNCDNMFFLNEGIAPLIDYIKHTHTSKPNQDSADSLELDINPLLFRQEPSNHKMVNIICDLLVETAKNSVYPEDSDPEILKIETLKIEKITRAATNVEYLNSINQILAEKKINIVVHLVTHRHKLADAVRALGWEKLGVCLRHPKFLAAAMDPHQKLKVVGLANMVVVYLDRMFNDIENRLRNNKLDSFTLEGIIREVQRAIGHPWDAMKANIYLDKDILSNIRKVNSESLEEKQSKCVSYLKRFSEKSDDLRELSLSSVAYEGEYLVQHILAISARNMLVHVAMVPEFKDPKTGQILEMQHVMIVPIAENMRYIIKIPESFFDRARLGSIVKNSEHGNGFDKCTISKVIKALRSDVSNYRKFSQAFFFSMTGHWTLTEQLLRESETADQQKSLAERTRVVGGLVDEGAFWLYEGYYLRQFGLRASAAKAMENGEKYVALSQLNEAGRLLEEMSEVPLDYRYRLAHIGWNLEVIATLVENGEIDLLDQRPNVQYPLFEKLKSVDELIQECLEIIRGLSERIGQGSNRVQLFYWSHVLGRSYQMLSLIIAIVKANLTRHNSSDLFLVSYQLFDGITLLDKVAEGDEAWQLALEQLCELTKTEKNDMEKQYPAAFFLRQWVALQRSNYTPPSDSDAISQLENARMFIDNVTNLFKDLEVYCRKLSPDGFSRRVFRRLKVIEYKNQRILLQRVLGNALERLEMEAQKSLSG